ncbi:MAG: adenosylmethionine--8-amino-7-oxononanoate transaminase [Acidobacteriota bacterium]
MSGTDLTARDARALWHPYTQHGLGITPLQVASARGAHLHLKDGRRILDAISSWWVILHGHCHPDITAAVAEQAATLEQVILAGHTHEPAVRLAEILIGAAREAGTDLTRVFYSDNGSTAVEVALKMAYQYHINRGGTPRRRFIALSDAYHGDTFGAMAVGEPEGFHGIFRPLLPPVDFVAPGDTAALARILSRHPCEHAAMIVEPLVQGAGGMRFYPAAFLTEAERLCREAGVLLIVDEVFTGFYRTGRCFAFEHAGVRPDLICLSKGLTGGFLPLAATLATEEIFEGFLSQDRTKALMHGHSFAGNPIACAAGIASWAILEASECRQRIGEICDLTARRVDHLASHPASRNARHLGTIGAIDLTGPPGYFSTLGLRMYEEALSRNVLLRPLGNVLYTVPPYCVTDEEIGLIYDTMERILDRCGTSRRKEDVEHRVAPGGPAGHRAGRANHPKT